MPDAAPWQTQRLLQSSAYGVNSTIQGSKVLPLEERPVDCRGRHSCESWRFGFGFSPIAPRNYTHYSITVNSDTAQDHGRAHSGLPQYNRAVATMLQSTVSSRGEEQDCCVTYCIARKRTRITRPCPFRWDSVTKGGRLAEAAVASGRSRC